MWRQGKRIKPTKSNSKKPILILVTSIILGVTGYFTINFFRPASIEEQVINQIQFDESYTEVEKQFVSSAIKNQQKEINGLINSSVDTSFQSGNSNSILNAYVPVTKVFTGRQTISTEEISISSVCILRNTDPKILSAIANLIAVEESTITIIDSLDELKSTDVGFVPVDMLSFNVKLLALNGDYYLDDSTAGAIFRTAKFTSNSLDVFTDLVLNSLSKKENITKVNQTGVTALTREMMNKLNEVNDPLYFSEKIGDFLSDADITHVSNEVSFKDGCSYSHTVFCSDPRFIETLKASGVDIVELTGNHNNDAGSKYNTETINLYNSLGWQTIGGGLNTEDAAKFYVANQKQSKIAFLGYNYPDSPNGAAIAGLNNAGANSFEFDRIKSDIVSAKQQSDFVIVDVQYWECYAYPDGYIEFPECDLPIGEQEVVFKQIIDLGADMVVGTQAHQPQTYEIYNGKPIYYGLGNLYFDQSYWPGTERGIILTHYFVSGKLVQTKLSPTVYDRNLQTQLMTNTDAVKFLTRLQNAR